MIPDGIYFHWHISRAVEAWILAKLFEMWIICDTWYEAWVWVNQN